MMKTYDVTIIGSGPAGLAAALTCSNQGLHCLLVGDQPGGKLGDITHLSNWYGSLDMNGAQLTATLQAQLKERRKHISIKQLAIETIDITADPKGKRLFTIQSEDGVRFVTKTLVIATGAKQKGIGVPGERDFIGKGVSYCTICDTPYYQGKSVALVNNSPEAFLVADELAQHAAMVYLFTNAVGLPGAKNVRVVRDARITRITASNHVDALIYDEANTSNTTKLAVDGVFIELGTEGNSSVVRGLAKTNKRGFIEINHATMQTSIPGIFAAGDVTNGLYKQVTTALSDGTKAALAAKSFLKERYSR